MNREQLNAMWNDDQHWTLFNEVYRCTKDPRIFVKKKTAMGWTVNFGHRYGGIAMISILTTLLLPLLLLAWRADPLGITAILLLSGVILTAWVCAAIRNEKSFD